MRLRFFIPFLIFAGLLGILLAAVTDPLVRITVEESGTAALGARVEIGEVDADLASLRATLKDLQVANPNDPWFNLLQAERVTFDLAFAPSLSKRAWIDEMTVVGLTFGQKREEWGGLGPAGRLGSMGRKAAELAGKVGFKVPDSVDLRNLTDPNQLKVIQNTRALRERLEQRKQAWKKYLALFEELKELATTDKDALKDPGRGVSELRRLRELQERLKRVQQDIRQDLASLKKGAADLDSLREKELDGLLKTLGLDPGAFDLGITDLLFGDQASGRIQNGVKWLRILREHLAKRAKREPTAELEPMRLNGQSIPFPITNARPQFVVQRLNVTARQDGIGLRGTGERLSLQPWLMDGPTRLEVAGKMPGGSSASLNVQLNYLGAQPQESFELSAHNVNLAAWSAARPESLPFPIEAGTANLESSLALDGEQVDGRLKLVLENTRFHWPGNGGAIQGLKISQLAKIVSGADTIRIDGRLGGTLDHPDIHLSTNLDGMLGNYLKGQVNAQVQKLRGRLDAQLGEILGGDDKALKADISSQNKLMNDRLAGLDQNIQELIAKRLGKSKGGKLPDVLKGVF